MNRATLVLQDGKALDAIKKGVDAIYEPVRRTLGPEAGTTLMYRTYNRGPRNVDDGFYTAEVISPKNPHVQLAAEFFKEATMRTNRLVGDGTSATTVIGGKLFNEIYAEINNRGYGRSAGTKVMEVKRDILARAKEIKEQIRAAQLPVTDLETLEKIAAVSLGEENEISKTIAKMAWEVGINGFIDVVEGYKGEIETELVKGMRFPAKVCGKAFVNRPERYEMVIEATPVFVTNHKLDNDLLVEYMIRTLKQTTLTILAPDFSDQVLVNMVLARKNGTFIWPVKVPSLRTEQLEDIAVYCGAKLYDKNKGDKLQHVKPEDAGFLGKLTVKDAETREDAVALGGRGTQQQQFTKTEDVEVEKEIVQKTVGGKKEKKKVKVTEKKHIYVDSTEVQERIEILKGQLIETKEPQFKMLMQRRIASLASAGGVIRVGSPTDAETLPLKLKIEDVVGACKAALKSGYVKGGGLCLKEIADKLEEGHVLKNALTEPYNQIQANAGGDLAIGDEVIDAADAVYYAVEHSTSVVASLITVKTLVAEEPELMMGEGQMAIAKAAQDFILGWKRKEGIMTENERLMEQDARGGLSADDAQLLDNG